MTPPELVLAAEEGLRQPRRRYGMARVRFFRLVERTATLLGGRAFYRRCFLSAGRFRVRREVVRVRDLPAGLRGFRIAQLSDLHGGSFLGRGDLADVVATVNAAEPDLCVVTGDFITHEWEEALPLLDDLAALRGRWPTLAVFGNHDYRRRQEHRIAQAYEARGFRFLRNRCERIDTGDGVLAVVGLEDLEEGKVVDLESARADVLPGDVEIVLCHNPGGGPRLAREGCACVLSGHTHGNQIDLPFLRRLGPPHDAERCDVGGTALVTSLGLGVVGVPLRVGAPAEVVMIELRDAEEGAS